MERAIGKAFITHDHRKGSLDDQALDIQERIMRLLGEENITRGRQIWIDKGYPDFFYKLLDEDIEFAEQVRAGDLSLVLNRLETEDYKEYLENRFEDPMDQILLNNLEVFKKNQLVDKFLATSVVLASVVGSIPPRSVEDSLPQSVSVRYDELRQLDPEATPERIDAILSTLPRGFVQGEITSISFRDEQYVMNESYGKFLHDQSEGAATASGGEGWSGTEITFWRGVKEKTQSYKMLGTEIFSIKQSLNTSSNSIWNGTLLHEIAHANDWQTKGDLTVKERKQLQSMVFARVQAKDRYRSNYVETISNENKEIELEIKATEYWAEIVEAYLKGDESLPQADFHLVRDYIAQHDPHFDRIKALHERLIITSAMDQVNSKERIANKDSDF